MMRKPWGGLCAAILLVGLVAQSGMSAPDKLTDDAAPAQLLAVQALNGPAGASLQVRASGPFSFTSYQPHGRALIVDLAGVVSKPGATDHAVEVDWAATYRLLPFRNASGRRVIRLDLTLARDCQVNVAQPQPDTLMLNCLTSAGSEATVEAAPAEVVPSEPAATSLPVASGPAKVRAIDVQTDSGAVVVDVVATGPLGYETLTLNNPTRLVIDLPQSVLIDGRRQYPVDQDEIVGVRVAQFQARPPVTRVVVDLLSLVPYEIDSTAEGLRVTLGTTEPPVELTQPPVEPAVDTEAALEVETVPVVEEADEPTMEPAPVLLASLAPMLPAALGSAEAPEPEAVEPVEVMETSVDFTPMTPAVEPAPITTAFGPTPMQFQPPVGGEEEGPKYSGEPISVNLKNVDLKDFFRLIHEISGLNIVVDPNVSGSVTMVLIDVPWDQALDIVLRNNRLGATLEGNVLRIATLTTLKNEQQEQRELAQAREEAVDPVTVTRTLSYASGQDLENTLRRFLSSRGEIIRDDRTNSLIIRDIPQVIPELDNLIEQLDKKSLQVEIEARIVSASRSFAREIGSQFATAFSTTGGRSVFGGALGESPLETGSGLPPPPLVSGGGGSLPLVSDFPAAATSGFLFGHRSPNFALDVILTAAETRNIAKVLSKPRLVTQNNVPAEVQQGQRIPVQTVVNNTISTQFIDVTLRLSVTPQITADGTVFMDIIIENNRIDAGIARINGIPALATQSTTTQVLVADGGTVVIGGVMTSDNSTNVAQVPLLGSVPIIGHLFKRTTVTTSTSELLFFISPRILPG